MLESVNKFPPPSPESVLLKIPAEKTIFKLSPLEKIKIMSYFIENILEIHWKIHWESIGNPAGIRPASGRHLAGHPAGYCSVPYCTVLYSTVQQPARYLARCRPDAR